MLYCALSALEKEIVYHPLWENKKDLYLWKTSYSYNEIGDI